MLASYIAKQRAPKRYALPGVPYKQGADLDAVRNYLQLMGMLRRVPDQHVNVMVPHLHDLWARGDLGRDEMEQSHEAFHLGMSEPDPAELAMLLDRLQHYPGGSPQVDHFAHQLRGLIEPLLGSGPLPPAVTTGFGQRYDDPAWHRVISNYYWNTPLANLSPHLHGDAYRSMPNEMRRGFQDNLSMAAEGNPRGLVMGDMIARYMLNELGDEPNYRPAAFQFRTIRNSLNALGGTAARTLTADLDPPSGM